MAISEKKECEEGTHCASTPPRSACERLPQFLHRPSRLLWGFMGITDGKPSAHGQALPRHGGLLSAVLPRQLTAGRGFQPAGLRAQAALDSNPAS